MSIVIFTGTCRFAQVFPRNRDMGGQDNSVAKKIAAKGGRYKITVFPDDIQSFIEQCEEKEVDMKPMNYPFIKSEEGKQFVILYRDHEVPGWPELGGPPRVVDAEGNEWDSEVNIGNGSTVEVAFDVWGGGNKKLRAIKVLELVEWNGKEKDPALDWVFGPRPEVE